MGFQLAVNYSDTVPAGVFPVEVTAKDQAGLSSSTTVTVTKNFATVSRACPSASDVAAIDTDFTLTFEADPTAGGTQGNCSAAQSGRDLTLLQANVYRGLATMRRLAFAQPLPWTSDQPYIWLRKAIRGMRFRTGISFCCDPTDTINVSVTGFSNNFVPSNSSNVQAISSTALVIHEARHNNGPGHNCGTRDQSVTELGAFGTQYYFLVWLADHLVDSRFNTAETLAHFRSVATTICTTQTCSQQCPA